MQDDVASGCVQFLAAQPKITDLTGAFAASDPVTGDASLPYIFRSDLLVTLEGTSAAAIVCTPAGSMATPPPLGTARHERLSVAIYVDPARDSARNVTESSGLTVQRGEALFTELHALLHRTSTESVLWGDMITVACALLAKGQFLSVPDGGGMQRQESFYGVTVWGWTDISVP